METDKKHADKACNMSGISPAMAQLPYPPLKTGGMNREYANLLSIDYCGAVSELSAVTQYINNENRLCAENCPLARTLLGIAMAEMMHLQKLGELIQLLGGETDFVAKYPGGNRRMWTPEYLTLPQSAKKMLWADMEAEKEAIAQYSAHIGRINDECVNAVLRRIILDEEYHIILLQSLADEL